MRKKDWTVCDFRNETIIKKDIKIPSFNIYLQRGSAGSFICSGGHIDAIIRRMDTEVVKFLVCEIKRYNEGKEANWFTHSGDSDEAKKINKVRDFWKIKLLKQVPQNTSIKFKDERVTLDQALMKVDLNKEDLKNIKISKEIALIPPPDNWNLKYMSHAWAITIGGQLEASFSKIGSCVLNTLTAGEICEEKNIINTKNAKRCLIFHKDSEADVSKAFTLLNINNFDMYTVENDSLKDDVFIWAFDKPNGSSTQNLEGWYPNPEPETPK